MLFGNIIKKLKETHSNLSAIKEAESNIIALNKETRLLLGKVEDSQLKLRKEAKELIEIIDGKYEALKSDKAEIISLLESKENAINRIAKEKSAGFPWLSEVIADFYRYIDEEIPSYLESKKHPAYKKAEDIREVLNENKVLRKNVSISRNFVKYYESLFPWITDYVGEGLEDLLVSIIRDEKNQDVEEEEIDPVLKFLPKSEYDTLSTEERNQKALDRYIMSRKKPYEIGRDYERYVGYLYEVQGYSVQYVGIENGLEDLGRDLICTKGNEIEIVQCKYWAAHKVIHEKHINQLYGTVVKYFLEHNGLDAIKQQLAFFPEQLSKSKIKATFVTSTKLSDTAQKFADVLGVKVIQNKPLERYPIIKCNLSINGDKIYHLPFDQQYDRTIIQGNKEFFVSTVKEAEEMGFRRAFKWRGSNS